MALFRSVLHAAMQTTREPTLRGGAALTGRDDPGGSQPARKHIRFRATAGLAEALERRAAAYGVLPSRYELLWLADFCDWKLRDLEVSPTTAQQTFDTATAYALPKIEGVPKRAARRGRREKKPKQLVAGGTDRVASREDKTA